jgi:DNA-directed RNA polymerase specialized sigma24 family protein
MAKSDQNNSSFYQTIARLSEPAQHAIWLRYREGLRIDEIAHVLNCAATSVESMLRQITPNAQPRPN